MLDHSMDAETFQLFRDQLRRFVRERLVPAEKRVLQGDRIPDDILNEMREIGLFGLTTPTQYGGSGMNMSQYIETVSELAWAMPAFRSIIAINVGVITSALVKSATEAQRLQWLPRLAEGAIASFALTEPNTGSDAANVQTTAKKERGGYLINGTKRYITNSPEADVFLVMARTSPENLDKNRHITAFIVPADTPGIKVGKPDQKMGQQGSHIADVIFDDVFVPSDAVLGEQEGMGFAVAMQSLDGGRLSVAAAACGYARRILESGMRYATERKAFGTHIGNFQLIQAMLADSKAEIYAAECMIRDATARADRGETISLEASCAKMFSSEMCGRVADRIVQIHGGAGYLAEYDAERFFRDSRIYRIYEGTTQIQQLIIAKRMLREFSPAFGA